MNNLTGNKMLPQVLDALEEIAFKPEFLNMRIEKERKAVLAEAQVRDYLSVIITLIRFYNLFINCGNR